MSFLWKASTMWMTELARNTNTAESRIGSQSELSGTIDDLHGLGDLQLIHSTSTTSYATRPVFRTASSAPSECHSKRAHRDWRADAGAMRHGIASDQDLKDRPGVFVRLETPARRHNHAVHGDARVAQLEPWPARGAVAGAGDEDAAAGALVSNSTSMKWSGVGPALRTSWV